MIWVPELSAASMRTIFTAILKGYLSLRPESGLNVFADQIIKCSVDIYLRTVNEFLPTPTKCHYTFNLRDLSKVIQGMLMCKLENIEDKDYLVKLYMCETFRVFRDRLIDEKDRQKFSELGHDIMENHVAMDWELDFYSNILFGDFESPEKEYIKLSEPNDIMPKLNEQLELYNMSNPPMNVVFFEDCIQHLARIARILRQERGNAMLVGVGGSGRRSMAMLGAGFAQMTCFQIEIAKNYREREFHDDIRTLLKKCGLDDETVQFLFSDTQIVSETFLEDINNLLNSGEIPNLFAPDEKAAIIEELTEKAKAAGIPQNRDSIYAWFVQMCRERLHIVLAFSPVGDSFRDRCRQFPSIINCATIDWYNAWPEEALFSVAHRQY
jgi:dynein heavy chain